MVEHLLQKFQHGRKDPLTLRQEGVLEEVGIEARQLHLALQAHKRAEGRAVQLVEPHGDAADIGPALRAPQEHARQQRIQRGVFGIVLPAEVHAEACRLKFIRLHGMQAHARHDGKLLQHRNHPFFFRFIIHQFLQKESPEK